MPKKKDEKLEKPENGEGKGPRRISFHWEVPELPTLENPQTEVLPRSWGSLATGPYMYNEGES